MERYIYINYAYKDYEYVQKIIESLSRQRKRGKGGRQFVCPSFLDTGGTHFQELSENYELHAEA